MMPLGPATHIYLAAGATDLRQAWRDNQLTVGFALGAGWVANENGEIFSSQWRVEYRRKRAYFVVRGSWVATECNSSANPTELSLLGGITVPLGEGRNRVNFGIGVGNASEAGFSVPAEARLKIGVFSLSAYANLNSRHSFFGLGMGFDFPLRIFAN